MPAQHLKAELRLDILDVQFKAAVREILDHFRQRLQIAFGLEIKGKRHPLRAREVQPFQAVQIAGDGGGDQGGVEAQGFALAVLVHPGLRITAALALARGEGGAEHQGGDLTVQILDKAQEVGLAADVQALDHIVAAHHPDRGRLQVIERVDQIVFALVCFGHERRRGHVVEKLHIVRQRQMLQGEIPHQMRGQAEIGQLADIDGVFMKDDSVGVYAMQKAFLRVLFDIQVIQGGFQGLGALGVQIARRDQAEVGPHLAGHDVIIHLHQGHPVIDRERQRLDQRLKRRGAGQPVHKSGILAADGVVQRGQRLPPCGDRRGDLQIPAHKVIEALQPGEILLLQGLFDPVDGNLAIGFMPTGGPEQDRPAQARPAWRPHAVQNTLKHHTPSAFVPDAALPPTSL